MPRPKKDPEVRRTEFINAAQKLFFSRGYTFVSVKDVLDAVGERAVSPSVFYYYFDSKEALYQAVMEGYCDEYIRLMEECFSDEKASIEERFLNAMQAMNETLDEILDIVNDNGTIENRLFSLDLRDRTTRRIGEIMAKTLLKYPIPGKSAAAKRQMSLFITGGISEIINNIMFNSESSDEDMEKIMKNIMQFTADVIGVPPRVLRRLIKR